jgi:hypothetical protein
LRRRRIVREKPRLKSSLRGRCGHRPLQIRTQNTTELGAVFRTLSAVPKLSAVSRIIVAERFRGLFRSATAFSRARASALTSPTIPVRIV